MSLPQPDGNLTVWFTVDDEEYEISQFNINFAQEVDRKGEPQTVVRGGKMLLTFTQILPETIYSWAISHNAKKSGTVEFRNESSNSPLKVEFTDGQCVNFTRTVDSKSGGLLTALVVTPSEITINGVSMDNHWTE